MSLNYTSYVTEIANLMVVSSADTNFNSILPGMIDYAEGRLYREVDFLRTQITNASSISVTVSSGVRDFTIPASLGTYVTVDSLSVITPAGTLPAAGTRVPLTPVTKDFIDMVYPSALNASGEPEFYSMTSDTVATLGPSPDAGYYVEITGEQRPSALSSANSSTYLTQYIPDVFIAASMVFAAAYQKDFGAQTDNSQSAMAWETQYQTLVKSVGIEQERAKGRSVGWTAKAPSPVATPPRG